MQIKTIRKNIENKMNEWIETITDEDLNKKVRRNILVSGGCITSMLLNEDINDYDVYIKDMDVLIELVSYYIKNHPTISILDGRKKEEYLKGINYEENSLYGISVNNLRHEQVKLFFDSKNAGLKIDENDKKQELKEYLPIFFSPNSVSLSDKIQIVNRFHGNNEEIHKTFDFIHATNYFTFKEGLVTNKEALESIICKQLKYQGSLYPLTSIIRMKKFIKKGWNINAGEILKIMFQISELNLKDLNVLEEQLVGVDIAYFGRLIEVLRGVPDNDIVSEYLNRIIDRVFSETDE